MVFKKFFVVVGLAFGLYLTGWAQQNFCIMELNTENFFDCEDNPQTDDDDFLPTAPRRWTRHRFWTKINQLTQEIMAVNDLDAPHLVALLEVENDSVMQSLCRRSPLRKLDYEYVMTNGSDQRGINVALMYRRGAFRLIKSEKIKVSFEGMKPISTRDILYVQGRIFWGDTLNIFVCHMSSKINGIRKTEKYRLREANTIMQRVKALQNEEENPKIIILGDFNETLKERVFTEVFQPSVFSPQNEMAIKNNEFYDLAVTSSNKKDEIGTYNMRGFWETIDHILVTGNLLNGNAQMKIVPNGYGVFHPKFLQMYDYGKGYYRPFKTYNGYRYQGGFSDHLPTFAKFLPTNFEETLTK